MNDLQFGASVFTVRESQQATHPNGFGVLMDLSPKLGVRALVFSNYVLPLENGEALFSAVFEFTPPVLQGQKTQVGLSKEDIEYVVTIPNEVLGATVVELKKEFSAKLESEGFEFLQVYKSVTYEENLKLVMLHVGSWHKIVVEQKVTRVPPVEFKYYFSVGTPITGKGIPFLKVEGDTTGPNSKAKVLALEVRQGPPDPHPKGFCGYPTPHFGTSMEAIANYYEELKLR